MLTLTRIATILAVLTIGFGLLVACSDDDTPEFPDPQADPQPDPEADPEPDPEADPEPDPEPGVVLPPPEGATEVDVTLAEWSVTPDTETVPAGEVYFLADNAGGEIHELVVVKSDLPDGDLPVEDGAVPENDVDFRGEIEGFAAGSQASGVFDLEPGNYILFCNIVEVEEDGEIESHYEEGMHTTITVE